ncbi:hypothetical protein [Zongyangia hominis]|uniref:Uncharacterized protein n=1 Tax=Zongyangia hominis TaxID=2763677 RepID=A0A926EG37_9FIRM|nr:hypothetical protein [Zongyangia hominis]MBC8571196.1 hypothetical protein [Zongyangia hominis]
MNQTKKWCVTLLAALCIGSMFLSWFGGARGVQEISGLLVLKNPATIFALVLLIFGIWMPRNPLRFFMTVAGSGLLLVMELFYFLTWHIETISGAWSIVESFEMAYPEFYVGFLLSVALFVLNLLWQRKAGQPAGEKAQPA